MPPIVETLPEIVWRTDARGFADYFSPRWCEVTGMNLEESLGFGWMEAIHPQDKANDHKLWQAALENVHSFHSEHRLRTADGSYRWCLCRAAPVKDVQGRVVAWTGMTIDVSGLKALTEKYKAAQEAAEMASLSKSRFLANMGHQIRTPLNVMLGFNNLLRQPALSREDLQKSIEVIDRNGSELSTIIDDILDMSKIETDRLAIEHRSFQMSSLLSNVISVFADKARDKNIGLVFNASPEDDLWIISDPVRIRQILVRVMGNAVKFTTEGNVTVSSQWSDIGKTGERNFTMTIQDTGCGISRRDRENLFEPFVQIENPNIRKYSGSGLGLALARRIAKLLGGDLAIADTEIGEGSTFVLSLRTKVVSPKDGAGASASKTLPRFDTPLAGLNVLVAEDVPDNQILFRQLLQSSGASVTIAANGFEAVQEALSGNFDVILMDIQMPILSGHDATTTLRAKGFDKPIIAITAHGFVEGMNKSRTYGCNDFLTKPIERTELVDTILRHTPQRVPTP
jgi:two-component system, sensor histidine kinase